AAKPHRDRPEDGVGRGPRVERRQVELEPEQLLDHLPDLLVVRRDLDAARRRLDPHLAAADHPVQAAFVPDVREVDAERAEALGRDREVVRVGEREEGQTCEVTPAWSSAVSPSTHEYM